MSDVKQKRPGKARARAKIARISALAVLLMMPVALPAFVGRTVLKPGWNLFSPQQDIQMGRQQAQLAEKQLPMLNDPKVDNYLTTVGERLAAHAPNLSGVKYPFQFRAVNDMSINAFALPGGFMFINRGTIQAADNEAELAAVMAHEMSHVILRHGTNQASKQYAAQIPLALLGGLLGSNSIGGLAAQLGASFATSSVLLKYSRTDETQADVMGTQILYDSGYDPHAMAAFFQKIEEQSQTQPVEFFSDHPSPDHRVERVNEEIAKLGGTPPNATLDTPEFESVKAYVKSLPLPKGGTSGSDVQGNEQSAASAREVGPPAAPALPSSKFTYYQNQFVQIQIPDNWQVHGQAGAVTFAPEGGIIMNRTGQQALAYGMIASTFGTTSQNQNLTLGQATDELVASLQRNNSALVLLHGHSNINLGGQPALSAYFTNNSAAGGREMDWVVTTQRPQGLLYIVCVAPQQAYNSYDSTFRKMVQTISFPQ